MSGREWLDIAESLLTRSNLRAPVCAPALAWACDLDLLPSRLATDARLVGKTIVYPAAVVGAQRNRMLLNGIAEYALQRAGMPVHDISKRAVVMRLARRRAAVPRSRRASGKLPIGA